MEEWLRNLFSWLPGGGPYYFLLGGIALFESVAGIGLLVPGTVLIVFAGFLVFHGKGEFAPLFTAAATGALAGDLLSFWLGARLGASIVHRKLFRRQTDLLHRAEIFFAAHGGKSVFFGRFVGPLRGLIPFVAGCTRMQPLSFFSYSAVSAALWGVTYPGLGYLGGASWRQVRLWSGRLGLVIILLLALVILNGLFWQKAAPPLALLLGRLCNRLQCAGEAILQRPLVQAFRRRYPRLAVFLSARFSLQRGSGLYLTVGFFTSLLFASFFFSLAHGIPWLARFDHQFYAGLRTFHHPTTDMLMLGIALLADWSTLLLLSGYLLLWLILYNRDFSALILLIGLLGGDLLLKVLLFFEQSSPSFPMTELLPPCAGFPCDQAFVFTLFCGLAIYFSLGTIRQWRSRITLIIAGSSLPLLVGISQIFLGRQWLTTLLAGFALAALWLTFLVTAAEMRRRYAGEFPWRTGWEPLHLSPRIRSSILLWTGLAVAIGIAAHLLHRLASF